MSAARPRLECLSTGSAAFDRILGGGLPVRSVNVIAGEPGAGKTIFALQMLFHLARQGKKGLYLTTLSEPSLKLVNYMQQFSFFDESLIADKRVVFADLGSVIRRKGADATLAEIIGRVEREEPAVVVIDSFKALRDMLGDARRDADVRLRPRRPRRRAGAPRACSSASTPRRRSRPSRSSPSPTASSGSPTAAHELRAVREVEVLKLRGANFVTGGHFFEIGRRRARVLSARARPGRRRIAEPEAARRARARPASPGSTTCSAAGCRGRARRWSRAGPGPARRCSACSSCSRARGTASRASTSRSRRRPNQLRRIAQGFGWDLRPFEERGLLTLSYVSPVELSTDRFLDRGAAARWSGSARAAPCSTA